ncbi:hypothetical protein [Neptunicella sp. SCSIO 80796]|uniref:hypothetical protein n=1 Tax=Neptunicella plasticusilytica TaxID=3117012 RepID=UPI003A4E0925
MATLKFNNTRSDESGLINMHINQQQRLDHLIQSNLQHRKWLYVLSERLAIRDCPEYCIKLNKPQPMKLFSWLEKIIQAGQANAIVVEELKLDEMSKKRLKLLCNQYKVTVVNLNLHTTDNLVQGPW